MSLDFLMHFTSIYHGRIPTKFNIHQETLYGEEICTEINVPETPQIAETEECVLDGTPYRFYENKTCT